MRSMTTPTFVCTENAERQTQPKRDPLVAKLSACYGSVGIGFCNRIRVCVDIAVGVVYHDLRLLLLLSDFLDLPTAGSADDGVGCDRRPAMLAKLCFFYGVHTNPPFLTFSECHVVLITA